MSGSLYSFADNTQVSGRVSASWMRGEHRFAPTLYVSTLDHLSRASSLPSPIAGTGDRQRQDLVKADLLYSGRLLGSVADAGIEIKREHIMSTDGRIEDGARTLHSVEPFAQYEVARGRWSVLPGARLTWNEQWGTALTPRVALRYRAAEALALLAGVTRTAAAQQAQADDASVGTLIVAHGGGPEWNAQVEAIAREVRLPGPIGVSFLMGPGASAHRFQDVVKDLVQRGARQIVVVPMLAHRRYREGAHWLPECARGSCTR